MKPFLTARWENLINLTYAVDPRLLVPYLPPGIEPDLYRGTAAVSFVAFEFLDTRVHGIRFPLHTNFPEVNLRCYVRYQETIGVLFIREFVPKRLIAFLADRIYNEPYQAIPMKSRVERVSGQPIEVGHELFAGGTWQRVTVRADSKPFTPNPDSIEHHFKEHSYGFGRTRSGEALWYLVDHPVWDVYPVRNVHLSLDFGVLYGDQWRFLNDLTPISTLLAVGSEVSVYPAGKLSDFRKPAGS